MALYAWQQRPAIDCLMNNYSEDFAGSSEIRVSLAN